MPGNSDTPIEPSAPQRKLTPSEIARDWEQHWNTPGSPSRAYVSKCIKRGCPTDSFEAARQWRIANSKNGIGYRSKAPPPTESLTSKTPDASPPTSATAADAPNSEARDLSSLESSLNAAIQVEEQAHKLVVDAQKVDSKTTILESRLRAYNVACKNRSEREAAVREELERRNILVPLAAAKALGRKGYDALLPQLRALAKNAGPLCNPSDPLLATNILERQIEAIIAQAQREYADDSAA